MPVLAQFSPQGTLGDSLSLMDRAAASRRAAAQEERAATEFEIAEPILRARANADLMKTDIEGAKLMEQQRQTAYTLKPLADRFFNETIGETNLDVREGLARDWLGRYAHLDNVREFEPEMKAKKDILAKILTEAAAIRALDTKNEAAMDIQAAKTEAADALAKQKADHDALMKTQQIQHDLEIARIRAESAGNVAGTRSDSARETATIRADTALKTAETRTQHQFELEKMKALRDEAIEKGDEESAAIFEGRIQKINSIAGEPIKALGRAEPKPAAAPKAAPVVSAPKDAATIEVDGKKYPIYKDKSGNRAYLIDGKYVPIQTK